MLARDFFVQYFETRGRDFPWRKEGVSPFHIMVTEMLLRQTHAGAVSKIWEQFTCYYPDPFTLANANKTKLMQQLKVLGLTTQRTAALIEASRWLVEYNMGLVPNNLTDLLKIPHIGNYTARAILCFAFGDYVEIVDVNILRFFSRYFGLDVKPDIRRNPLVWELARVALPADRNKVKQHNYGLLDFTATVCKSRKPECDKCALSIQCTVYRRIEKRITT